MDRDLSKYAAMDFAEAEVRSKLSSVITSPELVDRFTGDYLSNTGHVREVLRDPKGGDIWEEWGWLAEEPGNDDGYLMVQAGRVVWNEPSDDDDDTLDSRLTAFCVHSLMCGFEDSWGRLVGMLFLPVDPDESGYELAEDILSNDDLAIAIGGALVHVSDCRDPEILFALMPHVRKWAERGHEVTYPVMRQWSRILKDFDGAKYWAFRMGARPTPY